MELGRTSRVRRFPLLHLEQRGVADRQAALRVEELQARGVHRDMALAPLHLLGGVVAARAPFSVVFTDCVSMIAAVGLGSRPSRSRSLIFTAVGIR